MAAALFASKYYPTPINSNVTNNAINQTNTAYNTDQGDAKIDWNITQKDRLSARWSQEYQNDPQTNSLAILANGSPHAPVHNAVGTWTHTFGPNILNEARFGASWITLSTDTTFDPQHWRPRDPAWNRQRQHRRSWPAAAGLWRRYSAGTRQWDAQQRWQPVVNQNFNDTVIQFDDGVTITRGKHVFKTGFQMWRFRLNTFYSGNSGEYGSILFGGAFTGDPASDFFTGYPEANR